MLEKIKNRYFILSIFMIAFCGILVSQLINLQVVSSKYYNDVAGKTSQKDKPIIAPRGGIFDTNDTPIAINVNGYSVQIAIADMTEDQRNEMILKLYKLFEKNQEDDFNKDFQKYVTLNPIDFSPDIKNDPKAIANFEKDLGVEGFTTAKEIFDYLRTKRFKISANYSDEDAYKIITLRYAIYNKYGPLNPITICSDAKKETVLEIEEKNDQFPGVSILTVPVRQYIDATTVAHVLGYVGKIDEKTLQSYIDKGYSADDIVGKAGIEKAAESYLKGTDGIKTVTVNSDGRLIEDVKKASVPGKDVVLTVDMNLQKVTEQALATTIAQIRSSKNNRNNFGDCYNGSAVAIDVNTGAVLAMVSYPDYDPMIFLNNDPASQAQRANAQVYNRAAMGEYAPGSTFKALTAVAGLEGNAITPYTLLSSSRSITVEGQKLTNLEDNGFINLAQAIKFSSNTYFYQVGMKVGITNLNSWAVKFGLGSKTGIEIPESAGFIAPPSFKDPKEGVWGDADTALTAIGQRFTKATPLQLANYIATLANGGTRYQPFLIKKTLNADGTVADVTKPKVVENVGFKQSTLDAVRAGMVLVSPQVNQGLNVTVASKTGTAEVGDEKAGRSSNAIYVCYAPAEKPQIAIAIVMERGVWGVNSTPIANAMLKEYFNEHAPSQVNDSITQPGLSYIR